MTNNREDLLIRLRDAHVCTRMCLDDIDYIGTSLLKGWITPDVAVEMIHNAGIAEILADVTTTRSEAA